MTARVRERILGRTRSHVRKRWLYNLVVGAQTVEPTKLPREPAIALMAATSRIEQRHHVFRRTKARLLRAIRAMRHTHLTRGLN